MLNFKDWEKVGQDKQTTTLKHKTGHVMTLLHSKLPRIQQEHLKRLKFAEGTPDGTVGDNKDTSAPSTTVNVNAAPSQQPMQSAEAAPINVPSAPKTPNVLMKNGSLYSPGAAQTAQAGLDLGAQVAAEKGKADANYQQQYLNERQRLNAIDAQNINDLKKHTDDFAGYMKTTGAINPDAYLENKGAGGKMLTGIGLLLSGAGSGLSGQSNMAMDFLNKQIDRNIDAQKARSEQAKTVWGAYNTLYGNQNIANNLSKISMNDMLVHQAELTAAKLATPTAQANLMALKAQKAAENNKLYLDSAGLLSSTPNSNPGQAPIQPQQEDMNKPVNPEDLSSFTNGHKSGGASQVAQSPFGPSSAEAMTGKQTLEPDHFADSPILNAGSKNLLDKVQFGGSKAREDYEEVKKQYAKAQQADRILGQLSPVMSKLDKLAKEGGALGYIRRNDPVSSIPYVGEAAHKIVAEPISANPTNKLYDSLQTRITNDVLNALRGTEVSAEMVRDTVKKNLPERKDPPELVAQKERNIRVFIKNALDLSLLRRYKATTED